MSVSTQTLKTQQAHLPIWRQMRWNLLFYFVLLAIVPLGLVQYFTLTQTNSQAQKQVLNQLESVSGLKSNEIHQWLDDSHRLLRGLLDPDTTQSMVDLLTVPTDAKQREISQILSFGLQNTDASSGVAGALPLFGKISIYDTTGKVLASSEDSDL